MQLNINLESEISFSASRSSGPGGQNVNKVNTRVILRFDVTQSSILSAHQKTLVYNKLSNRINKDGELIVACEETRSQLRNRELALNMLHLLVANALKPRVKRKPTKPTRSAKLKRLQNKKLHGQKKANRRKPDF
ncbi:aminoacyl-tRNA hydrolase [Labilibacter sediminis]|nr:aminoacyl-tRNA hydrolase [Labilibacter sediminis]